MERPEQFKAYTATEAKTSTKKSNIAAIVGGVVGGIVALTIIAALIIFCLRKRKGSRKTEEMGASSMMPMANEKSFSEQFAARSRKSNSNRVEACG